ncbi:MAG TPA: DedA family protein [Candidatus Caccomorpha excrementavium]|nr:DedA family protein [Candidatus Caccomorpha excrementavium]
MNTLLQLLSRFGLAAMLLMILLEYACFPISSEIVLPFCGAAASAENISFFLLLPASVTAGLLGTGICYLAGRIGGNALLNRLTKKFPKTERGIRSSREKFEAYGAFAVCFGRLIPICRTYIAFIAGAAGQKPSIFFGASAIGITVWNTILIGLGYLLRENWADAAALYIRYKNIFLPVCLLILLFLICLRRKRHSRASEPT